MRNAVPVARLIKRYAGARLYDADAARYVSLEDLAGFVDGQDRVRIVDASTGLDVTEAVLTEAKVRRH
jgi:polyhydroxyalkanoate synthesis regulator protein